MYKPNTTKTLIFNTDNNEDVESDRIQNSTSTPIKRSKEDIPTVVSAEAKSKAKQGTN